MVGIYPRHAAYLAAHQPPRDRAGNHQTRQQRDPNQHRSYQHEQESGGNQAEKEKDQYETDRSQRTDIDCVSRASRNVDAAMRPTKGFRSFGRKDFRLRRRSPRPIDIVAHVAITRMVVPRLCNPRGGINKRVCRDGASPHRHDGVVHAC
jgi:hypothetical protein